MIVPRYWAEGRVTTSRDGKQLTLRRFGWSDDSEADAQAMADARAKDAAARFARGESLPKREPKVPYNGAEGVPIREEIVDVDGTTIITRNAYGALCLNTPDVLFVDLDFEEHQPVKLTLTLVAALMIGAVAGAWALGSLLALAGFALLAIVLGGLVALKLTEWKVARDGGPEEQAWQRLRRFVEKRPQWHLRVYRTPSGLRALAMHDTLDPTQPEVQQCFDELKADRLYARMCVRQRCFRARLTAKPWRIGITDHLRPRPGVWPVNPDRMPERRRWLEAYDEKAKDFAACRFVTALGSRTVNPHAEEVRRLHDEACRAYSELPLA